MSRIIKIKAIRTVVAIVAVMLSCAALHAQRKITPVNTPATATQPINELANDTARINAKMRASMAHYHDQDGNIIYIDTITGKEWRDSSAMMNKKKPMTYPLFESVSMGVDVWNPLMRAFGQHYGIIDFMAQLSLHNRYKPVFETGLGIADNTPADNNFTYKSPLGIYFRIGLDYNFLYNSTTDYQFFVGLRFGYSPFTYEIKNITINSSYWGEMARPVIPSQTANAEWWELAMGLRVKLWGPISAGWAFRYHNLINVTKGKYGEPWYIPGYGTNGSSISGSVSIIYTLGLNKKTQPKVNLGNNDDTIYFPEGSGQPSMQQINNGMDAQNPE